MSNVNDMFQVDYLPEKREIKINLPDNHDKTISRRIGRWETKRKRG